MYLSTVHELRERAKYEINIEITGLSIYISFHSIKCKLE